MTDNEDPADQGPHQPRVTGSPESIWLVYGDLERDDTHEECSRHGDVTWCEDVQFSSDVRYVRADLFEEAKASELRAYAKLNALHISAKAHRDRVRELEAELERLRPFTYCGCGDQFSAHDPGTCGNCVAAMGKSDA